MVIDFIKKNGVLKMCSQLFFLLRRLSRSKIICSTALVFMSATGITASDLLWIYTMNLLLSLMTPGSEICQQCQH